MRGRRSVAATHSGSVPTRRLPLVLRRRTHSLVESRSAHDADSPSNQNFTLAAQTLSRKHYEIRLDSEFASVIDACATTPRKGQRGTWITDDMREAYLHLHRLGHAHSVETWIDGRLAGGLYGLAIGKMFYGESMFSHITDASKIALAHLARHLETLGFGLIDCQMSTPHLASLGAREIRRHEFINRIRQLTSTDIPPGHWAIDAATHYHWE